VRHGLLWKLLAIHVSIIMGVILVLWLAIDYLAADYFSALMEKYNVAPAETHQMFLDAVHRYLMLASLAALALAAGLSFWLTRRALDPLARMADVTRRISQGDYGARVPERSRDEFGDLARAFNQMADSLETVERLRRTMVVDVAHELRTPLTNVRGYLEGLADGVVAPSKETFDMLQREILRLVRLVEDLHALTAASAARGFLRREAVAMPALVRQVLDLYRFQIDARRIAVETRFAAGAPDASGDADKLLQVLRNLIENATRHADEGGGLWVGIEPAESGLRVTVANSGGAIGADELPLIFERFWRADASRSRASGGAGIGLAIVKELVEAHGGRVGAGSAGGETRVWFELPAWTGEARQSLQNH
jgi:signal transduction histidine kinase